MPDYFDTAFEKDLRNLSLTLHRGNRARGDLFFSRVMDIYRTGKNKDILVVVSPGGWGNTPVEMLQPWEKSIVTGVTSILGGAGYSVVVAQYLRSGTAWYGHIGDIARDIRFFTTGVSPRAEALAEGIELLTRYLPGIYIVLVGASQGAAFNNATLQRIGKTDRVFSVELGTFFPYMKRRIVTDRSVAIDSNGMMPDPMCNRNLRAGFKSYFGAFGRWFAARTSGKKVKFSHCINTPGHEYNWEYPAVHTSITRFLNEKLGKK